MVTIPTATKIAILTLPMTFCELPDKTNNPGWKQRRTILVDISGDVSTADVLAANPELVDIPDDIKTGRRSIDDFKKVQKARRAELASQKVSLPARIDELSRTISDPTTSGGSSPSSPSALEEEEMRKRRDALSLQRAERIAGGPDQEKKKRLRELEDEAESLARKARQEADAKREEAEKVKRAAEFVLSGERAKLSQLQHEISMDQQALDSVLAEKARLLGEWKRISAEVFE